MHDFTINLVLVPVTITVLVVVAVVIVKDKAIHSPNDVTQHTQVTSDELQVGLVLLDKDFTVQDFVREPVSLSRWYYCCRECTLSWCT